MDDFGKRNFYCSGIYSTSKKCFDRFIPFRPYLDINTSHQALIDHGRQMEGKRKEKQAEQYKDDKTLCYNKLLSDALGLDKHDKRLLPVSQLNDSGYASPCKSVHSPLFHKSVDQVFESPVRPEKRQVKTSPDRILDMPKIQDDFYTNIFDWGKTNKIAVALQQQIFIWDVDSEVCRKIVFGLEEIESYNVSALVWDHQGHKIAVADNQGTICICDPERVELVQQYTMKKKESFLAVRWTEQGIFSGTRKGTIYIHDPRCPKEVATLEGHQKEICGLQIPNRTQFLASGGDEGTVCIWDLKTMSCYRTIEAHAACSKALAWCPWRRSVIASGGGSADGYIRLWQIHTGEKLGEIYTKSQVCGLLWSEEYRELASSHGSTKAENNDIILWKQRQVDYEPIARLRQHFRRPLHMSLSPDGTTLASAGADEALCLWKCFPSQRRREKERRYSSKLTLDGKIR